MEPLINLENIERSWPLAGGCSWVLRNINLQVAEGDFVSVTGPSGSGKSSLLNVLGLMDSGFDGRYHLAAQPVHELNARQRQSLQRDTIGFIFQHYHLIDELTVAENMDLPCVNTPEGSIGAILPLPTPGPQEARPCLPQP